MENKPWGPARLKNISLPLKTKCVVCKRVKQLDQFSTKQLNDMRFRIYKFGQANAIPKEGLIRCRECTGVQNTEMKCSICLIIKPLDGFSLAQRGRKDTAVCLPCQEDLDETHPDDRQLSTGHDHTHSYDDEEDGSDSESATDTSGIWLWDPRTGNYATEEESSCASEDVRSQSHSGVSIVGHRAEHFGRVESAADGHNAMPKASGGALTRKNLAKLSLYGSDSRSNPFSDAQTTRNYAQSNDPQSHSTVSHIHGNRDSLSRAHRKLLPRHRATGAKRPSDESSSSSSDEGMRFRAYDPSGNVFSQRRAPSTLKSGTESDEVTSLSETSTAFHNRTRKLTPAEETPMRGFARVRPQNRPLRRFIDDDYPDPYTTPSQTRINSNVMEQVSSDED